MVLMVDARARGHGDDAVGQQDGFQDIVRDEHDGAAGRAPDTVELTLQHLARLRIEGGERLVHQNHRRLVDEHAGNLRARRMPPE